MIYLPSESPSPERPPSINREIIGVLLAMACISGLLIHYSRDTWCDLPFLSAFCLPPLTAPRQEAKVDGGAADDDAPAGGGLSRPSGPMTAEPTVTPADPFALPTMAVPTPAGFPTPFGAGMPSAAYPGPGMTTDDGFPGGLAPAGPVIIAPPGTATSAAAATSVDGSPDYPATATALAQSSASDTATATPSATAGATPTDDDYPGPTNTGTPSSNSQ